MAAIAVGIGVWQYGSQQKSSTLDASFEKFFEEEGGTTEKIKTKVDRSRYFFRMLRDPGTNSIPPNIRNRELSFARQLPTRSQFPIQYKRKDGTIASLEFVWQSAGPLDVGGRTRALAIDQYDLDVIIAGGTSGGMWKSTDGGSTWELKTDPSQHMSVTSVAQDPTAPDTWYYTSGELRGNTASDRSGQALYFGTGVFRSTDNGETWNKISTTDDNDTDFNSPYDFISRVVVSPATGSVFIASNGIGIYRSTDTQPFPADPGPGAPPPILGSFGGHRYADIAVGPDGRLIATLSSADAGQDTGNPGVFVSYNDGDNWAEITSEIENYPTNYERSVVGIAPSAPDSLYILTYVSGSGSDEDVRLHFVDLNNFENGGSIQSEDRSANIPDFGGEVGHMSTQVNYNMEVAVKPDDPDFVMIGGINLFRSRDGFKTGPAEGSNNDEKDEYWIGGYAKANNVSIYPNQHPDQHVITFDPKDPDIAWAGHDGGLSKTSDITADAVTWTNMNNGYVTTQFYAVDIPEAANDNRLMGGTQDNGTPYFTFNSQISQQTQSAANIFTGDGGYSFFTPSYLYVSAQNGTVLRWQAGPNGDPNPSQGFSFVHPRDAAGQFFIHPYAVDPNDQDVMYYPAGDSLLRNSSLGEVSNTNSDGTTQGWNLATEISAQGYLISTLEVAQVPSGRLYYGAYSSNAAPRMYRLDDAQTSTNPVEISIPEAENGSYPHDIAINPSNGDEVLAVFSNYDVPSVFHSTDGGETWQNVDGNLEGVDPQAGPSVRSASIIQGQTGAIYLLGTSTGIYSTTNLDGNDTSWIQEAPDEVGYTVTEYIATRSSDGTVAAGTHGRGIFKGDFQSTVTNVPQIRLSKTESKPGKSITISAVNFNFSSTITDNQVFFNDFPAEITNATQSELTVVVPRLPSKVLKNNTVNSTMLSQVQVKANGNTVTAPNGFFVSVPEEFVLHPNYPNPFNPSTTIPVDLPVESGVIIQVFDMSGRKVLEPVRRIYEPNNYNFQVDLNGLASGVYIYRVISIPQDNSGDTMIKSGKMTLIK